MISVLSFLLCNGNFNGFLTMQSYGAKTKGLNYSREETICGNTIHTHYINQQLPFKFKT